RKGTPWQVRGSGKTEVSDWSKRATPRSSSHTPGTPAESSCGRAKWLAEPFSGPGSNNCVGHYSCLILELPSLYGNAAMPLIPASYIEKNWRKALAALEYGRLEFIAPNGEITIAEGRQPGPHARFHIHEWDVLR